MADKTPVRVVLDASNVATGLAEFQSGDTLALSHGGTGTALSIGLAGQVLRVNANRDALEFVDSGDIDVIASSDSTGVQVQDDLNVSVAKIEITQGGFKTNFGQTNYPYDVYANDGTCSASELLNELKKINLDEIVNKNKELMENIDDTRKEIDKRKIAKPDTITGKRRLDNLEKWDEDILRELVGLSAYLIIGISFGIYCIYNFFVVQLK